jgi:hypothetical protein
MTRLVVAAIRSHRTFLVLSTVGLGVVGSRLAGQLDSPSWWLLAIACALILWLSDVFRGLDARANDLAGSGRVPYRQAAADLVSAEKRRIVIVMATSLAAVGLGVFLLIVGQPALFG